MEEKFNALERRYNLLVSELQKLEKKNIELSKESNMLMSKLNEANQAANISNMTMANVITEQNKNKEAFSQEITGLKNKIKLLES